ncbi:MAG TPA: ATP-binding cassette domain-containing protein [Ignavibacteriaceae bacterium]|nr:ATP-binding cassette domain-containing protein [Ignavibacteriaceae bacterium]
MDKNILSFNSVSFKYPDFTLQDINFNIQEGKIFGIAGESGSGKTTILKLASGFLKPSSGEIKTNSKKKFGIQVLFQNSSEIINPYRKIKDILYEAYNLHHKNFKNIDDEVNVILELVNFNPGLLESRGSQLSGGEQQRAALARILAVEPELLILDEPFSAQDYKSQLNFINIIKQLNKGKEISILCISHSLSSLVEFADEVIILYKGKIIEMAEAKKLEHFYSNFLLEAEKYNLTKKEIEECLKQM